MKKKKILIVSSSLRVGGLERVAVNCAKYSDCGKYNFDFLVFGNEIGGLEQEVQSYGWTIIRIKKPENKLWKFYKEVCRVMKENGPYDAVHSHTFFNSGIVLLAAKHSGIPCRIAHSHSIKRKGQQNVARLVYNWIMRRLLNAYSTTVCACSVQAGNYLFGEKRFQSEGIIIPNVIDPTQYAFDADSREQAREEFNIAPDTLLIGQIGHLSSVKNPCFLLKVFSVLVKNVKSKLILVGDGPLFPVLRDEIANLGLTEYVIMPGIRNDVSRLMSAMDVYVCTSTNEGFGLVLLEALANGLPCVGEKNAIVKEIVEFGHCTLVDSFNSAEPWAQVIEDVALRGRIADGYNRIKNSIYTPASLKLTMSKIYQ